MSSYARFQKRRAWRIAFDRFSKSWRRDARLSGKYGTPKARKPSFGNWMAYCVAVAKEQAKKAALAGEQRPVVEDPWVENPETSTAITIPMAGDEMNPYEG